MHRFFEIEDLVLYLLPYLRTKKDVYHFGASCKGLWEIVEDKLWATADWNMLDCLMPQPAKGQLWTQFLPSVVNRCRKIRAVDIYAFRFPMRDKSVKMNHRHPELAAGYDPLLDLFLFLCMGPGFPNMHDMKLTLSEISPAYYVRNLLRLFPDSIQNLEIILEEAEVWEEDSLYGFITALRKLRPRLKRLDIKAKVGTVDSGPLPIDMCLDLEDAYANVFFNNPALIDDMRSISLFGINDGFLLIPTLAELPLLEHLDLCLTTNSPIEPYELPQDAFPNLTTLLLRPGLLRQGQSNHHPPLLPLLESLYTQNLQQVAFTFADVQEYCKATRILAGRWSCTLNNVSASIKWDEAEARVPLSTLLEPLLPSRQLRSLTLKHESCISIRVEDIRRLVTAFPQLEELRLATDNDPLDDRDENMPSSTSPQVLSVIAGELQRLRHLTVAIDFDLNTHETQHETNMAVVSLDLFLSRSDDVECTVNLIKTMFPNLRSLDCDDGYNMEKVRRLLKLPMRMTGMWG